MQITMKRNKHGGSYGLLLSGATVDVDEALARDMVEQGAAVFVVEPDRAEFTGEVMRFDPRTGLPVGGALGAVMGAVQYAGREPVSGYWYAPTISAGTIYDGAAPSAAYRYNHDVSVEYFDGLWHAAWNANARKRRMSGQRHCDIR
jgi:hypothetical protein